MQASLRRWPILLLALIAISVGFLARTDSVFAYAPSFTAHNSTKLCKRTTAPNWTTDCTEVTADLAINNASDRTLIFELPFPSIPAGPTNVDYNFSQISTYLPATSVINPSAVPIGGIMGRLHSDTALGLTNNPCVSNINVDFFFYNSTLGGTTTAPLLQTAAPSGGEGVLEPLRDDDNNDGIPNHVDKYPSYLNKIFDPDRVGDINHDGDEADSVSEVVLGRDLNGDGDALDAGIAENGGTAPVAPIQRLSGSTIVANTAVVLEFIIFSPGAFAGFPTGHPLRDVGANAALGYPVVTVLQDPTVPAAPGSITDFCSSLLTRTVLYGTSRDNPCTPVGTCPNSNTTCTAITGNCQLRNSCINEPVATGSDANDNGALDLPSEACPGFPGGEHGNPAADTCDVDANEAGCDGYHNPAATGQVYFLAFNQSLRDADGDGIEGAVDTCANTNTGAYNPRSARPNADDLETAGILTGDGLPGGGPNGGCDPDITNTPAGVTSNQDGDSAGAPPAPWENTGDNCPTIGNPDNWEADNQDPFITSSPLNGPRSDGIGDACEIGSNDFVGNGIWRATFTLEGKCIGDNPAAAGDLDNDNDGYCDATETARGSSNTDAAKTPENAALTYVFPGTNAGSGGSIAPAASGAPETATQCYNTTDDDSDTVANDGCAVQGQYLGDPKQLCNDGVDNDGDGSTDAADAGCTAWFYNLDPDADGYLAAAETHVGTKTTDACGNNGWPSDLFFTGASFNQITLQDIGSFIAPVPYFGTNVGTNPGDVRWDVVPGPTGFPTDINVPDLGALIGGATGPPPMLYNQTAFGSGITCPVAP